MKKQFLVIFLLLASTKPLPCSCECSGNCRFNAISNTLEFVALIKVIEYTDYYEYNEEKSPYSMTVEIIKKYKGSESRKKIKIWGDNGALCRPYIEEFEIGNYYLIAPSRIEVTSIREQKGDYDFFSCWTDYLKVDFNTKIAYGEYSWWHKKITLDKFEQRLKK